jgi:hypothetical protein
MNNLHRLWPRFNGTSWVDTLDRSDIFCTEALCNRAFKTNKCVSAWARATSEIRIVSPIWDLMEKRSLLAQIEALARH